MPLVQFQTLDAEVFEKYFQLAVEAKIERKCETQLEAYVSYQNMGEHMRWRFWDVISQKMQVSREKIYKFFRFTWSRKFYEPLQNHRDEIRGMVFKLLHEMKITEKTPEVNQTVWIKVWDIFRHYNLHYDGTDQLVRNSVNLYFGKMASGVHIEIPDKIQLKPFPTDRPAAVSTSRPKHQLQMEQSEQQAMVSLKAPRDDKYQYFGMEQNDVPRMLFTDDFEFCDLEKDDESVDSNVEPNDHANFYDCLKQSVLGVVSNGEFVATAEETIDPELYADPIDWDAL
uniref:Uncharacterized protein n=1 Tax=Trepomonas sp. PC1 TaxID=1076344 RepID=A0A146K6B6_9EUKA|eukprot:JAP92382.1 Hypothetical protein TPC1_15697 [Trepomonas sp. PC1]